MIRSTPVAVLFLVLLPWLAGAPVAHADTMPRLIARLAHGFTLDVEGEQAPGRPPGLSLRAGHLMVVPEKGARLDGSLGWNGQDTGAASVVVMEGSLYLSLMGGQVRGLVSLDDPGWSPEAARAIRWLTGPDPASRALPEIQRHARIEEQTGRLVFVADRSHDRVVLHVDAEPSPTGAELHHRGQLQASVRFSGLVVADPQAPALPYPQETYPRTTLAELRKVPARLEELARSARATRDAVTGAASSLADGLRTIWGGGH